MEKVITNAKHQQSPETKTLRGRKRSLIFMMIFLCCLSIHTYGQYKYYFGVGYGARSYEFLNRKYDLKAISNIGKGEGFNQNKINDDYTILFGVKFDKHFGLEFSPKRDNYSQKWFTKVPIDNRNYSCDVLLKVYHFPIALFYKGYISSNLTFSFSGGGFYDYVYRQHHSLSSTNFVDWNIPNRFYNEYINDKEGIIYITPSNLGVFNADQKQIVLDKLLYSTSIFGCVGSIQLGMRLSEHIDLFLQVNGFKSFNDLEKKSSIIRTEIDNNGNKDTVEHFSLLNNFKEANNNNPRLKDINSNTTILYGNAVLGLK